MDAPGVPQPTIGQFCAKVCGWVRFWPDHDAITAELTAHLEDHRDVLLKRNPALSQAEAEAQAVAAMGDPEAVQLTLRFDRYGKIQLSFPLSLKGGGADV